MKRLIGVIFIIAGVALIIFGYYEKGQINMKGQSANEKIEKGQSMFHENPVSSAVGGSMQQQVTAKVAHYHQMVMWIMIIGAVIAIIGIGLVISCGCNRRR
jgi:hypothetical protein